jgi:hypothetical protein
MRTDRELRLLWRRTDTPVIDALARKIHDAAFEKEHEIDADDFAEMLFEAFKAGYCAASTNGPKP